MKDKICGSYEKSHRLHYYSDKEIIQTDLGLRLRIIRRPTFDLCMCYTIINIQI